MKKARLLFLFLLVFLTAFTSRAQSNRLQLDSSAEVSLYTCGSGSDLYSIFGHTAVRVWDSINGYDRIYNYGTFSFGNDFYLKFTKGQLDYMLSAYHYRNFESSYRYEGRYIIKQVLNINHLQKEEIFTALEINALPQNKYYRYDFFYDNCTTRSADIFESVLGDQLEYPEFTDEITFRDMIDHYLQLTPWPDLGIDIVLGSYCDTVTNLRGQMFLPERLHATYENTKLNGEPFMKLSEDVFMPEPKERKLAMSDPIVVFGIFFVLILLISNFERKKGRLLIGLDIGLFTFFGLLGWFLVFMWFGTDHNATKANYNLIWALPLHFPLAFFVFRRAHSRWTRVYMIATALLALVSLLSLFIPILPEAFHPVVRIFSAVILIRLVLRLYLIRKSI